MSRFTFYFLLILLIVSRYFLTKPKYQNGEKIRITTTVYQEPTRYSSTQKISLKGLKIYLPLFPEIHYGDRVIVEGIVENKEVIGPELLKIDESQSFLFLFRKKVIDFLNRSLPEPHAALVAGITLGSKSNIPYQFWSDLKKTGTLHVVVASGMNVTFVAAFLLSILVNFMPRKKVILPCLLSVWMYVFLVGMEAPIVRAGFMISIAFLAQSFGRLSTAVNSLFISALIMLLIKPEWITDLGFLLSFFATAGLIFFEKGVEKRLKFVPKFFKESLSTTIAAQMGVAPILFVTFGGFNILSPFINALVLWTIPIIMIMGSISGVLAFFLPNIAKLVVYLSYPFTWWFVSIVRLFS